MGDNQDWGANLDWYVAREREENLENELKEVFPIRKPSDFYIKEDVDWSRKPLSIPTIAAEFSVSADEVLIHDEIPGLGYVCVVTRGEGGTTIHTTMGHVLTFEPGYETKILVKRMA